MQTAECYQMYLAFKNHFTNIKYDYIKYRGKLHQKSLSSLEKRKDKYYFEKLARKYKSEELQEILLANFVQSNNPARLWIGDIASDGESKLIEWKKRAESLTYNFTNDIKHLNESYHWRQWFETKNGSHPPIVKLLIKEKITLETFVILDKILCFSDKLNKKVSDPAWDVIFFKCKKYSSFLNIDNEKYKQLLKTLIDFTENNHAN